MSDDIIRSKGYAVYKHVIRKALSFLVNAVLNSVVTDYKTYDVTVELTMRISEGKVSRRVAKIVVKDRPASPHLHEELDADAMIIERSDLDPLYDSGQFEHLMHVMHEIEEKGS